MKHKDYKYELIYDKKILGEEEREERIEALRGKKYKEKVKTIMSGSMLESEIYPVYEKSRDTPRADKKRTTEEAMKKYNDKMAMKQMVRLINTNFGQDDLYITLTYPDKVLPTESQARKDMTNYIRRLKDARKKLNLPELKYLYVIEFVTEEEAKYTRKVRIHHHLIINKMDRDLAEEVWRKAKQKARAESRRLQPDDFGLEGVARYLGKWKKGKKRWYSSRNLKKPTVNTSVTKLSKRKVEKIAREPDRWKEIFEAMYKHKYSLLDVEVFYSDIVGGFYIRARMKQKE